MAMINADYKFIELLQSLEYERQLFFAGKIHKDNEKKFIYNIDILNLYLDKISDAMTKLKVKAFVDSVLNHDNYRIYKREIDNKNERKIFFQEKREQDLELCQNIKEQINKNYSSYNLNNVLTLFNQYKELFLKYCPDFYLFYENQMQMINILATRNIYKLIHFTDIRNLSNILKFGLLPREDLMVQHIQYFPSDNDRLDNRLDCTSTSIEYPNYIMLANKQCRSLGKNFCILVLDARRILLNNLTKYYVYINAASKNATWWLENETLSQTGYLGNMFWNSIESKGVIYSRDENMPKFLPTHPQAEILIKGKIGSSYIQEIHFESEDDYKYFLTLNERKEDLEKFDFKISNFYYQNRDDINWEGANGY